MPTPRGAGGRLPREIEARAENHRSHGRRLPGAMPGARSRCDTPPADASTATLTNGGAITTAANRLAPTGDGSKASWRNSHRGGRPDLCGGAARASTAWPRVRWRPGFRAGDGLLCGATVRQNRLVLRPERTPDKRGGRDADGHANSERTYGRWVRSESQVNRDDEAPKMTLRLGNGPPQTCSYRGDRKPWREADGQQSWPASLTAKAADLQKTAI